MAVQQNYVKALADQYYRQLQQGRPGAIQSNRGGSAGGNGPNLSGITLPNRPGSGSFANRVEGAIGEQSTLGKIIDVMSRPLYSVGNAAKEAIIDPATDLITGERNSKVFQAIDRGDNPINTGFNALFGSQLSGWAGRSKVTPSQAAFSRWEPKSGPEGVGKFAAGLTLDIGLDPLTYIPGAAIASVAKKLPGVAKGTSALQKGGMLEKPAAELPKIVPEQEQYQQFAKYFQQLDTTLPAARRERINKLVNEKAVPQESVRHAASTIKFDADLKPVYDLKRLPNPFSSAKPKPAARRTGSRVSPATIKNFREWMAANADTPLIRDESGKLTVAPGADAEITTPLSEMVDAANIARSDHKFTAAIKDEAKNDLDFIHSLYQASKSVSKGGASKSTPSGVEAVTLGRAGSQPVSRADRIREAKRQKNLDYLKKKLSPEDYIYLVRAKYSRDPGATYKARSREILSRTHSPVVASPFRPTPQEAIIEAAVSAPVGPRVPLNPRTPIVEKAIDKSTRQQFKPEDIKARTAKKDIAVTSKITGAGKGTADRGFNKRAQVNSWKVLLDNASKAMPQGVEGTERASLLRARVFNELLEHDAVLRSRGIEPILGEGHSGVALSLLDVLKSLDTNAKGSEVLLNNVFDLYKGSIQPSALLDAVEALLVAMTREGVRSVDDVPYFLQTLKATKGEPGGIYDTIGRAIGGEVRGAYSPKKPGTPNVMKGIQRLVKTSRWDKKLGHTVYSYKMVNLGGKEFSDIVSLAQEALTNPATVKALVQANIRNSAHYNAQFGYEVQRISDDVVNEFFSTWTNNATSAGEAMAAYNSVGRAVNAAGDAIDASSSSRAAAGDIVRNEVDDVIAEDLPMLENLNSVLSADTVKARNAAGQRMYDDVAAETIEKLPVSMRVEVGEVSDAVQQHMIVRALFPFTTKYPKDFIGRTAAGVDHVLGKFIAQTGHATIRPALTQQGSVIRNLANGWRDVLTQVHKVFPDPKTLEPIMIRLQRGEDIVGDWTPAQAKAIEQFTHLVKVLFEPNTERGTKAATGVFFRNANDVDHINGKLAQMKFPEHMRFDADAADNIEDLANQWRNWKIENPVDFMARMQATAVSVNMDTTLAREVSRIARSKNLMSMSKREGFVQIKDSTGKSVLTRYLPENAWYHKDIVEEIKAMDSVLQQSLSFDSPFGIWVNTYLDPFLNMWKAGMTIYRPGHHVRNLIGDSGLSFLADGLPRVHHSRNALKIMGMKDYDDFSALAALQGSPISAGKINEATLRRGSEIVAVTRVGGKELKLTAKEVNDYVRSHGMLPDFVSGEDLIQSADKSSDTIRAIQEFTSFSGGKVRRAAGRVSENRDDYVRLTHFLQIIEKNAGKFKTQDELMQFAVSRVRKWHPDGTDLSPFETKVMRRVFPFYSWTKKSLPLVVESMLMQPGRIMVWPKATYNAGLAAGIDLNSISDPFPPDQLFPSFLTDEMSGPVAQVNGQYFGVNPGLPNVDLMNQFIGDPKAATLGMLSPFIKGPAELVTGTRMDTGSPVHDTSEYIGSSVPGLAQAQSLSGVDILGTLLGGQGRENITSVDRQNRGQIDPSTIANFLFGLGITNMSKPSFINYAEIEKRNQARKAAGNG